MCWWVAFSRRSGHSNIKISDGKNSMNESMLHTAYIHYLYNLILYVSIIFLSLYFNYLIVNLLLYYYWWSEVSFIFMVSFICWEFSAGVEDPCTRQLHRPVDANASPILFQKATPCFNKTQQESKVAHHPWACREQVRVKRPSMLFFKNIFLWTELFKKSQLYRIGLLNMHVFLYITKIGT